jgi:hypothetical protein
LHPHDRDDVVITEHVHRVESTLVAAHPLFESPALVEPGLRGGAGISFEEGVLYGV